MFKMICTLLCLLFVALVPCVLAGTTTSTSSSSLATTLVYVPTSSNYSTSSSFTMIYPSSVISLGSSLRSAISSNGILSSISSSSWSSASSLPSAILPSTISSTSVPSISSSTLTSEQSVISSSGYSTTSISPGIFSTTAFPSDTSILSSVSSSNLTPTTTTSSASTCSATLSSTDPCPPLELTGGDLDPDEKDMPLTDQKLEKCKEYQASHPPPISNYGPPGSPGYNEYAKMSLHCALLKDLAENVKRRKEYIINTSLAWRSDCVQDAVAWLKKWAPYIEGLNEWLEEHKEDWLPMC
ncbi:hypothetical protein OCU04_003736 [Sclerotinia nivalis]|uniref:Uncharacterized protein n=1 Tax=Sclerotinia nivalis TaxID=352851 RepID=A0A9X0ASI3_9HELO|nr:hypothetical protein OCU04_003736 [Sclerotinia nivalis]